MNWLRVCLAVLCVCALPVSAAGLKAPEGRVLLTLTGNVGEANSEQGVVFDRAMLEALDWREVQTYTSFTQGPQVFAGPTLASVLEAAGAKGSLLTAAALNDYEVQIPVEHAAEHDVLLALDHNGTPMRVRDKGPIWVIYPLTESEARTNIFDGEMIWQLRRIEVD